MRIDLAQLSLAGLTLDIPRGVSSSSPNRAAVESAESVRGVFEQSSDGFRLSDVGAARVSLGALAWTFGQLLLQSEQAAELVGLTMQAHSAPASQSGTTSSEVERGTAGALELTLQMTGLAAGRLVLTLGTLRISAQVDARNLQLSAGPSVGVLRAEHAVFSALEVRTAALALSAPTLTLTQLAIDWGGADFRLEAGSIQGGEIALEQAGVKLRGSALTVSALRVVGAAVQVERARFARLDIEADLPSRPTSSAPREPAADPRRATPAFDYELLNGLSGQLNVDVAVDLAVPIIGRRRATHQLRIALEEGALDYRELEHNLARLEDSLLDFSVRDGALVLERGLPLIATRGRGKPIVIWDLDPDDLALAEARRVRLAVLPRARLASAGQSEPPSEPREEGGSALKLRHLSLQELDAVLRLVSTTGGAGAIRDLTFSNLLLRGTVHHDPEGPTRAGQVRATLEGLRTALRGLRLGVQQLSLDLQVGAVRDVDVRFEDVAPRQVTAVVDGLELSALSLG
jgi:hypothetical protein